MKYHATAETGRGIRRGRTFFAFFFSLVIILLEITRRRIVIIANDSPAHVRASTNITRIYNISRGRKVSIRRVRDDTSVKPGNVAGID